MSKWTVVDIVRNQLRKILDLAQGASVTVRPIFGVKTVEFNMNPFDPFPMIF
jgi:hypothetical protein